MYIQVDTFYVISISRLARKIKLSRGRECTQKARQNPDL